MHKKWMLVLFCALILAAVVLLAGCKSSSTTAPADTAVAATAVPAFDGAAMLEARCTGCHGLEKVTSLKKTQAGWNAIVSDMIGKGAKLNKDEKTALVEYLAKTYAP